MRVRTGLRGEACEFDRLGGGVGTGPGDHRHAPRAVLDGHTDQLAMFVHGDRGRLAGRADDHDAVGTFGDVPVDEAAQRGKSRLPSSCMGVTMATSDPVIMASDSELKLGF